MTQQFFENNFLNGASHVPRPHEWAIRFRLKGDLICALASKGVDTDILRNLDLLADSGAKLPDCTLEPIELSYKGHPYSYPQRSQRNGTQTITFKEIVDANNRYGIWNLFQEWINLGDSAEDGVGLPTRTLKCSVFMDFYQNLNDTLAEDNKIFTIELRHAMPTDMANIGLSQEPTEIVKPAVTISYDFWKYV